MNLMLKNKAELVEDNRTKVHNREDYNAKNWYKTDRRVITLIKKSLNKFKKSDSKKYYTEVIDLISLVSKNTKIPNNFKEILGEANYIKGLDNNAPLPTYLKLIGNNIDGICKIAALVVGIIEKNKGKSNDEIISLDRNYFKTQFENDEDIKRISIKNGTQEELLYYFKHGKSKNNINIKSIIPNVKTNYEGFNNLTDDLKDRFKIDEGFRKALFILGTDFFVEREFGGYGKYLASYSSRDIEKYIKLVRDWSIIDENKLKEFRNYIIQQKFNFNTQRTNNPSEYNLQMLNLVFKLSQETNIFQSFYSENIFELFDDTIGSENYILNENKIPPILTYFRLLGGNELDRIKNVIEKAMYENIGRNSQEYIKVDRTYLNNNLGAKEDLAKIAEASKNLDKFLWYYEKGVIPSECIRKNITYENIKNFNIQEWEEISNKLYSWNREEYINPLFISYTKFGNSLIDKIIKLPDTISFTDYDRCSTKPIFSVLKPYKIYQNDFTNYKFDENGLNGLLEKTSKVIIEDVFYDIYNKTDFHSRRNLDKFGFNQYIKNRINNYIDSFINLMKTLRNESREIGSAFTKRALYEDKGGFVTGTSEKFNRLINTNSVILQSRKELFNLLKNSCLLEMYNIMFENNVQQIIKPDNILEELKK